MKAIGVRALLCVAIATAAGGSMASGAWGFRYQFSTDATTAFDGTWGNRTIDVHGGDVRVKFRVVAYADPGTNVNAASLNGPAIAFFRINGSEQLRSFGGAAGDSIVGPVTRGEMISSGSSYLTSSYISADNALRLGGNTALSSATNLLTRTALQAFAPSTGGTPKLDWVVRFGEINVAQAGGARTIVLQARDHNVIVNGNPQHAWFHDATVNGQLDVSTAQPDGPETNIDGRLVVLGQAIPAPAGSLVFFAVLAVVPRRRR